MGIFRNSLLQCLIHEATSNLSAAISTSSKPGAVVVDKLLLYMKFSSSMRAASSVSKTTLKREHKKASSWHSKNHKQSTYNINEHISMLTLLCCFTSLFQYAKHLDHNQQIKNGSRKSYQMHWFVKSHAVAPTLAFHLRKANKEEKERNTA